MTTPALPLRCARCGLDVRPENIVGQWDCRFHPGTLTSRTELAGRSAWSCCGLVPQYFENVYYQGLVRLGLQPGDLAGCTRLDHGAPGAAALALVPAYLAPRPPAASVVLTMPSGAPPPHAGATWRAGGRDYTIPATILGPAVASVRAAVTMVPAYWRAQPDGQAKRLQLEALLRTNKRARGAPIQAWRPPPKALDDEDDEPGAARGHSSPSDSESDDVPAAGPQSWRWDVVEPPGLEPEPRFLALAGQQAAGLPVEGVTVVQRCAPEPDAAVVKRLRAAMAQVMQ